MKVRSLSPAWLVKFYTILNILVCALTPAGVLAEFVIIDSELLLDLRNTSGIPAEITVGNEKRRVLLQETTILTPGAIAEVSTDDSRDGVFRRDTPIPRGKHYRASLGNEDSHSAFLAISVFPSSNDTFKVLGSVLLSEGRYDLRGINLSKGDNLRLTLEQHVDTTAVQSALCASDHNNTQEIAGLLAERDSSQHSLLSRSRDLIIVEFATEADQEYVSRFGGAAQAFEEIQAMVNIMNGIYEPQVGASLRIVFQHAWESTDPYTSNDASTLLSTFASYWHANFIDNNSSPYRRALAHMWTGRTMNANVGGIANTGSLCLGNAYAISKNDNRGRAWTATISAHESGHVFGAYHDTSNNPLYIMWQHLQAVVTAFSPVSITNISDLLLIRSLPSPAICLLTEDTSSCPADINSDSALNVDDIEGFSSAFISGQLAADVNKDGLLNVDDIELFVEVFLAGCD